MNSHERALYKTLKGIIVSYRKGPKTQNPKECLLRFPGVETDEAAGRLIGRKVAWPVEERRCRGKIVALHGKNGIVRARFNKGVPGQALGSWAEIIG
ncbi:MAG: 50S ribosomal protein L35Ae [Candidatus Bathyarchaeota archaeon BA1]|nr:MAG: 50S ribosomal protein L35Ae [Candidatus Bathyarchaeota archaeon BA1]